MLSLSLMVLFALSAFGEGIEPMKGSSHTEFGDYTIMLSENPLVLDNKELITYDLQYSNVKQVIRIGIEKTKRCRNFVVKYPNFEIQYVCSKKGFGVKRVDPEFISVKPEAVTALLDETQFNYQQLILSEEQETEELLHLIACFFPKLINAEVRKMSST